MIRSLKNLLYHLSCFMLFGIGQPSAQYNLSFAYRLAAVTSATIKVRVKNGLGMRFRVPKVKNDRFSISSVISQKWQFIWKLCFSLYGGCRKSIMMATFMVTCVLFSSKMLLNLKLKLTSLVYTLNERVCF